MDKIKNNILLKYGSLFVELILYYLLFVVKKVISFGLISHITMIILILLNFYYFYKKSFKDLKFKRSELILFIIINLLISFCISGKVLFMYDYVMTTGIKPIIWFIMVNVFVFPFTYNILHLIDNTHIINNKKNEKDSKKFALRVFLITFITWMIIGIAFYPGNITIDSVVQIQQAIGEATMNSTHPIFSTLYIKWLLMIWYNPFIIIIANILLFSFVITHIYKYLYEKNVNVKFLYISLLIFILSVNNISMITMVWKDIPFSISMLWLTFELYKIVNEKDKYFKKSINIILLIISLIFTYFFRQNGVFPFIVAIIYLLFLVIKLKEKIRIISTVLITILLVLLIKGPVFSYYVTDDSDGFFTSGSGSFAAKGLGALVYYDAKISDEDKELISKMGSFEDLKLHYNAYSIDTYSQIKGWGEGIEKIGINKLYEAYIRNFFRNPKVIIRDKLDGSNLLWSYATPADGYIYSYDYGVDSTPLVGLLNQFEATHDYKYIPKRNFVSKLVDIYQKKTERFNITNMIFWRFGFVLSLLFIISYYMITKNIKLMPVLSPTAISILFWLVLMNHCSYRYLWFLFLNTFFILIFTLIEKENKKKKGKRND
jgi:hypothetical protein